MPIPIIYLSGNAAGPSGTGSGLSKWHFMVMSAIMPETPLSSRCGFVRGRKRIKPHPVSELRKATDFEMPSTDEENEEPCSLVYFAESPILPLASISESNSFQERKPAKRYPLRKKSWLQSIFFIEMFTIFVTGTAAGKLKRKLN